MFAQWLIFSNIVSHHKIVRINAEHKIMNLSLDCVNGGKMIFFKKNTNSMVQFWTVQINEVLKELIVANDGRQLCKHT